MEPNETQAGVEWRSFSLVLALALSSVLIAGSGGPGASELDERAGPTPRDDATRAPPRTLVTVGSIPPGNARPLRSNPFEAESLAFFLPDHELPTGNR